MPCTCDPISKDGYQYVQWIGTYLGDCVRTPIEIIAFLIGIISILAFIVAMFPQMWKNYKRKTVEGFSFGLLVLWTFGDISNLFGAILTGQLAYQKLVGFYFLLMDILLGLQFFWYKSYTKSSETEPLLSFQDENNSSENQTNSILESQYSQRNGHNNTISKTVLTVAVAMLIAQVSASPNYSSILNLEDEPRLDVLVFWTSLLIKSSTEGISLFLFGFAVFGNITYGLSILLRGPTLDYNFYVNVLPFLCGSIGVRVALMESNAIEAVKFLENLFKHSFCLTEDVIAPSLFQRYLFRSLFVLRDSVWNFKIKTIIALNKHFRIKIEDPAVLALYLRLHSNIFQGVPHSKIVYIENLPRGCNVQYLSKYILSLVSDEGSQTFEGTSIVDFENIQIEPLRTFQIFSREMICTDIKQSIVAFAKLGSAKVTKRLLLKSQSGKIKVDWVEKMRLYYETIESTKLNTKLMLLQNTIKQEDLDAKQGIDSWTKRADGVILKFEGVNRWTSRDVLLELFELYVPVKFICYEEGQTDGILLIHSTRDAFVILTYFSSQKIYQSNSRCTGILLTDNKHSNEIIKLSRVLEETEQQEIRDFILSMLPQQPPTRNPISDCDIGEVYEKQESGFRIKNQAILLSDEKETKIASGNILTLAGLEIDNPSHVHFDSLDESHENSENGNHFEILSKSSHVIFDESENDDDIESTDKKIIQDSKKKRNI
ncbi:hypothetical protein HK096_009190 [Nowakowskiella sp. JEL0078]|nr:hypothetical protein HK096_009190 [Nowakowskiella sp. JEL0078]